ncbi:hypothetical protein SAMN05443144_12822 [Fodinibius roseus]|uniref:Uncharacterized protein n=1 Tax=Fodinibius roseus TaxID=1194090 RepID=A0A1M5JRN2_9BACT|nr:hypothetical protein [Fodinibius roseus]SHG43075.1 hypothetical protein SAMN05443144_12822 [Fodinibius roseus]
MQQEEINKGSRLIENIMGSTIKIAQENVKDIPLAFLSVEDMKFHQSWKWMMPVVIKIEEDLGYPVMIRGKSCTISADDDTVFEYERDTKLEAIWQAVVNFLEWHEQQ